MVQPCRRCGQMHDAYTGCTLAVRAFGRPTMISEDEALVGNVVGERYQVGEVLGQGTTGTVFDVTHVSFARAAAMKVLRPRFASGDLTSRVFHGEARAAWSVTHPGLVEVFDIGSLPDGTPFFVMEKLEGETLAARIARERLSLGSAVDVTMQMLSAIAAIHARDLLLRDLRPQNLFLAHRRGCRPLLKILDFGLARLTPLESVQQEWDAMRAAHGTDDGVGSTAIPYYLSPERSRGEHGIEPASDLFVAAVILYEALAGEKPFNAPSFNGVLHQISQGKAAPLHERAPNISPDLSGFIARSLSPNPRARPTSAKDMQDELRSIFEGGRRGGSGVVGASASISTVVTNERIEAEQRRIEAPPASTATATYAGAVPATGPLHTAILAAPNVDQHHIAAVLADAAPAAAASRSSSRPPNGTNTVNDEYFDETETQREVRHPHEVMRAIAAASPAPSRGPIAIGPIAIPLPTLDGDDELSTAAGHRDLEQQGRDLLRRDRETALLDEASAENVTDRTLPPPTFAQGEIDIDVSFDDSADKTMDKRIVSKMASTLGSAALAAQVTLPRKSRGKKAPGDEEEETETMELTPELRARVDQMLKKHDPPVSVPPPAKPKRRR